MTDDPIHVGRWEGPHAPLSGRWVCADDCPHPDHREAPMTTDPNLPEADWRTWSEANQTALLVLAQDFDKRARMLGLVLSPSEVTTLARWALAWGLRAQRAEEGPMRPEAPISTPTEGRADDEQQ